MSSHVEKNKIFTMSKKVSTLKFIKLVKKKEFLVLHLKVMIESDEEAIEEKIPNSM